MGGYMERKNCLAIDPPELDAVVANEYLVIL